jgi:pre-rRNA-processing protein TSR3
MANEWRRGGPGVPPPVLLDPYAKVPISPLDRTAAASGGLLVVDCSWNKLSERGGFPSGAAAPPRRVVRRRLPLLIAGNPQHYGRLAELNTVEAFGAALWVLGRPAEAQTLLESFHGGAAFLELNAPRLASYATAEGAEGIETAEVALFGGGSPGVGRPGRQGSAK